MGAKLEWTLTIGHKENHQPVLHLPQLFYFIAFASIMLFPCLLAEGVVPTIRDALKIGISTPR